MPAKRIFDLDAGSFTIDALTFMPVDRDGDPAATAVTSEQIWTEMMNQLVPANLDDPPDPPSNGQIFYDNNTGRLMFYDGVNEQWILMGVQKMAAPFNPDDAATVQYVDDALTTVPSRNPSVNLIINSTMANWQRGTSLSLNDDEYGPDGWYALTESGSVSVEQLADVDDLAYGVRITNTSGGPQRFGIAQIVEHVDSRVLIDQQSRFDVTITPSVSGRFRVAFLEWQGAPDVPVHDFVDDWTSSNFNDGPGRFFVDTDFIPYAGNGNNISAGNAERVFARDNPTDATRNLLVFIWTEDQMDPGDYFDVARIDFHAGQARRRFEAPMAHDDLARCLRRFWRFTGHPVGFALDASNLYMGRVDWPVPMRAIPTLANASFSVDVGATGTPAMNDESVYAGNFSNSDADWTAGAAVLLSADLVADL